MSFIQGPIACAMLISSESQLFEKWDRAHGHKFGVHLKCTEKSNLKREKLVA